SIANTHVVRHAGKTLALMEFSLPYEISNDLKTLGVHDFGGTLTDSMTAHPKICPTTGELHFFGCGNIFEPHVSYHRADADGQLTISRPIDVPALTLMHDFALTAEYVVFLDLPLLFDPGVALTRPVSGCCAATTRTDSCGGSTSTPASSSTSPTPTTPAAMPSCSRCSDTTKCGERTAISGPTRRCGAGRSTWTAASSTRRSSTTAAWSSRASTTGWPAPRRGTPSPSAAARSSATTCATTPRSSIDSVDAARRPGCPARPCSRPRTGGPTNSPGGT